MPYEKHRYIDVTYEKHRYIDRTYEKHRYIDRTYEKHRYIDRTYKTIDELRASYLELANDREYVHCRVCFKLLNGIM